MAEITVRVKLNKIDIKPRISNAMAEVAILGSSRARELAPVDTGKFKQSIGWARVDQLSVAIGSSDVPGKVLALEHGHSKQAPAGVFMEMIRRYENQIIKTFKLAVK
jgi:hypothetical protein